MNKRIISNVSAHKDYFIIISFGLAQLLIHFVSTSLFEYGVFRDEIYYMACSNHLAFGYVDHPPLSIYLLKLSTLLFGNGMPALRILPALTGSAIVMLTGFITKKLDGGHFSIFLSGLASFFSLIILAMTSYYSMNCYDILIWSISGFILIKIIKERRPKLWILLGVILGLGLLNKIGVLFLGSGIFVGLLLTSERIWLKTKWPYIALGIAFILFLPYILWNVVYGFPHLEFIENASREKYASLSPAKFIIDQFLINNPLNAPLWIGGLLAFIFYKPLQPYKIIAFVYLTSFIIFIINGTSKAEYLAPAYPMLFAGGAVYFENLLKGRLLNWIRFLYPVLITAAGVVLIPFVMPMLAAENFIHYSKEMGLKPESNEGKELSEMPQFYADRFGWEEKAKDVAEAFHKLSPKEKSHCAIYAANYGRCAALDYFGKQYSLPPAIGGHNNYWLWGPGNFTGEIIIILGGELKDHLENFESCTVAGKSSCGYCMPYENNLKIFVCRRLKIPLDQFWLERKHYE